MKIFINDSKNNIFLQNLNWDKDKSIKEFITVISNPDSFFGITDSFNKIIQFYFTDKNDNNLLIDIPSDEKFISYQKYASKEECINIIKKIFKVNRVFQIDKLFKVNIIEEDLDIVLNKNRPFKTYQGKEYTKEEWKNFEEEEYRKYVEQRSGKKSSFLADDKIEKQNFSAESGKLTDVKYFVMNSKQDKVPVYEYPSTMAAPFTFLNNGTAIEVIKYEQNGWCEILSKEKKKAYIQSNHVKKND